MNDMAKSNSKGTTRSKSSSNSSNRAKPVVMRAGYTGNPRRRYTDGGKLK